jgi:hypothetical protein
MARALPKGFGQLSTKHVLVDKANTAVIVAAALAAAIVVFSLFASKALIDKISYQNKVISKRSAANEQLEKNIAAKDQLVASYTAFSDSPESVLGTPESNSKIVLDALPSKYDFPALATSLDGIITGAGMSVESISGSDQETTAEQSNVNPQPVTIPFEFGAKGSYEATQKLINDLQRSIRPFRIISIDFTASDGGIISVKVIGETYYQPAKDLGIQNKKVGKDGKFVETNQSASQSNAATTTTSGGAN